MSYRTDFEGQFDVTPALTAAQCSTLRAWSETRHDGEAFPSVWCMWVPNDDGTAIVYSEEDGSFYEYEEWLNYLIDNYLKPWGVTLSGEVTYQGEEPDDRGTLYAHDNEVRDVADEIVRAQSPFRKR